MTIIYDGMRPGSYVVREAKNVHFYFDTKTVVIDEKDTIRYTNDIQLSDLSKGVIQLKLTDEAQDDLADTNSKLKWFKSLDDQVIEVLKIGFTTAVKFLNEGDPDLASDVGDEVYSAMRELADGWTQPCETTTYRPLMNKLFWTTPVTPVEFDTVFGEGKTDFIKNVDTRISADFARKLMLYFNTYDIRPTEVLSANVIS